MMRRRLMTGALPLLGLLGATGLACAADGVTSPTPQTAENLRAFDPQDYALAFDVLLGAGDLQRAFLVAQKAVASAPRDRVWRLKLAKVSVWTQRPDVAAQQWVTLFEQGDHSVETLKNTIQWAPTLHLPQVALRAWTIYMQHQRPTEAQWLDILALYESLAEPGQGSLFFENQFQRTQQSFLLDYAARLADYAGEDARAEQLYARRAELAPFSLDSVLRAVVILVRRDKFPDALALMKKHESQVGADAADFWQLLGQVAWEVRDYESSRVGYERLARLPQAVSDDWSRLIYLMRQKHPKQAADLALEAYRRFGSVEQLLLGLGIYAELGDALAQTRVFAELGGRAAGIAAREPRFLMLRAQFYQKQNKPDLAWSDLRQALRLSPQDTDVIISSFWFLIDSARTNELQTLVHDHARLVVGQPRLWLPFAAANQLLERHREAVHWYSKIVATQTDDPLMLLNYADALERVGQTGMADRLRRHAWLQLKARLAPSALALGSPEQRDQRLALLRLSLLNQPGDPSLALVRRLLTQLSDGTAAQQDEQLASLVLGWSIVREQFENARTWMWQRYTRQSQLQAPLWGLSQTALQLKDTQTMDSLLSKRANALPIYNRYDIAYDLGHAAQALDIAFNGMSAQDDEPLYDRYRQHVPAQANYVQVQSEVSHGAELSSHGLHFETRLVVNPRLHVVLSGMREQQQGGEPLLELVAPPPDRLKSIELRWMGEQGQTSLALFQHDEFAQQTGFRLTQSYQWSRRLSIDGGMDFRVDSTVTEPMRVIGYENSVYGAVTYTLGQRETLRVAPRLSRYYSQFDDSLGASQSLDLEAIYRFKSDYPDWRIRTYLTRQVVSKTTNEVASLWFQKEVEATGSRVIDYFLPDSSTNVGACVGMGDNLTGQAIQSVYTRAWRPFMDLCLNHNSDSGLGINGILGIAGSVSGEDHLRLQLQSSDGTTPNSAAVNSLALRYRHYF